MNTRRDFLKILGITGAAAAAVPVLAGGDAPSYGPEETHPSGQHLWINGQLMTFISCTYTVNNNLRPVYLIRQYEPDYRRGQMIQTLFLELSGGSPAAHFLANANEASQWLDIKLGIDEPDGTTLITAKGMISEATSVDHENEHRVTLGIVLVNVVIEINTASLS